MKVSTHAITPDTSQESHDTYGDFALSAVPADRRKSFWSTFLVYSGMSITVAALYVGASLGAGLALGDVITATIAGYALVGAMGGVVGILGSRHGVSTVMMARHAFGRWGANLISLFLALVRVGWPAFHIAFFAGIINAMFPGSVLAQPSVAAIWGGALMMSSAIFGFGGLAFVSFLTVPLMLLLILAGGAAIIGDSSLAEILTTAPGQPITWLAGVNIVCGSVSAAASVTADMSRYNKSGRDAFWSFLLSMVLVLGFVVVAGGFLLLGTGSADLPAALTAAGFTVAAMLIVFLGQWTTIDNDLYSAAMAALNVFRMRKWLLTAILGTLAIILAVGGIVNHFVPWMNFLGTYIPPIAGIIFADYFIVKPLLDGRRQARRYEFGQGTEYDQVNVLALFMIVCAGYVGSKVPGVILVNAIVLSLVGYPLLVWLCRILKIPYRIGKRTEDATGF